MEGTRPQTAQPSTRVRLTGRLDSLTTCKSSGGYALVGKFRLDSPYHGLSSLPLRLPMGSSLLSGDSAVLEGMLVEEPENILFDCCT
ncbi:MAG TPA: hypothetical protein VF168_04415 [Trueperaceae bacterium]